MGRKKLPPEVLAFFKEAGRRGGKIGGKRAMETMTPEARSERARNAVAAREAKRVTKPKRRKS